MRWRQRFHPRVAVRIACFSASYVLWPNRFFFSIECLHRYLQLPQEEPHYSQLTAVKYPCSCSSQIPLRQRQSITHPSPQPLSNARLHKHILCNVEFSQICPVKPQALQTVSTPCCVWRPQSVYHCISTCMTCFCLKSSFSSIQRQLPFSVPCLPILSASHRSLLPPQPRCPFFEARLFLTMALRTMRYPKVPVFWCCSFFFSWLKAWGAGIVLFLSNTGLQCSKSCGLCFILSLCLNKCTGFRWG